MPTSLLPLITFLAVTFAIVGAWSLAMDLFLRDRSKLKSRLEEELHNRTRVRARQSLLKNLNQNELSALVSEGDERLTFRERVQEALEQAGLLITPRQLGSYCLVTGCGCGLFTLLIRGHFGIGLVASAVGAWLPWLWVKRTRIKRQAAMRLQLADAFELMSCTLQAGQSMAQAMQAVAADFPAPIAEEFLLCSEQQNLGLDPEISMRQLARRTGMIELQIFVVAVLVQRQVGGNLAEILRSLAQVVRERFRIQGMVEALTAEGRMQAMVLMALAPFLLVVMLVMNRGYINSLLEAPWLLFSMVGLQALGWLWIRKIVNFEF